MKHFHITILLLITLLAAVGYNVHLTYQMKEQEKTLKDILETTYEAVEAASVAANNASDAYQMAMEARDLADEAQYQARQRQQIHYDYDE